MFKILKNLNKKQKVLIIFSIILICLQVWLELKMPDYMATITTLVETEGSKMIDIIKNGSMMLLCALGSLTTSILTGYLLAYVFTTGLTPKERRCLRAIRAAYSISICSPSPTALAIWKSEKPWILALRISNRLANETQDQTLRMKFGEIAQRHQSHYDIMFAYLR